MGQCSTPQSPLENDVISGKEAGKIKIPCPKAKTTFLKITTPICRQQHKHPSRQLTHCLYPHLWIRFKRTVRENTILSESLELFVTLGYSGHLSPQKLKITMTYFSSLLKLLGAFLSTRQQAKSPGSYMP